MPRPPRLPSVLVLALLALPPASADAADGGWRIDTDASLVAVVTLKEGIGARLAHNHLVTAGAYRADLAFDPADPAAARFRLDLDVGDLAVDDPAQQRRWQALVQELGILDEPFTELSEGDRRKVRDAMLGKKQLDADQHPRIRARAVAVRPAAGDDPWQVDVELTVRGQSVTRTADASHRLEGDVLEVRATVPFAFTDFAIEPYSALLGAIRNADTFHVVLHLVARRGTD